MGVPVQGCTGVVSQSVQMHHAGHDATLTAIQSPDKKLRIQKVHTSMNRQWGIFKENESPREREKKLNPPLASVCLSVLTNRSRRVNHA